MNPNCDNDRCDIPNGEVRLLPVGGDGNAILCRHCYDFEIECRLERGGEHLPKWESLKVYAEGEKEQPSTITKLRAKKYRCKECGHEVMQSTNHYGETYSWGNYSTCPKCPPYKRPNTWICCEATPSALLHPEKWTKATVSIR